MMSETIQLLDLVALTENIPERGLSRGQIGTVVEVYTAEFVEVEFSDAQGRTYVMLALPVTKLMRLHYAPA